MILRQARRAPSARVLRRFVAGFITDRSFVSSFEMIPTDRDRTMLLRRWVIE